MCVGSWFVDVFFGVQGFKLEVRLLGWVVGYVAVVNVVLGGVLM